MSGWVNMGLEAGLQVKLDAWKKYHHDQAKKPRRMGAEIYLILMTTHPLKRTWKSSNAMCVCVRTCQFRAGNRLSGFGKAPKRNHTMGMWAYVLRTGGNNFKRGVQKHIHLFSMSI